MEERTVEKQDAGEPFAGRVEAAMAAWSEVEAVMAAEEQAWPAGSSAQLKAFLLHVERTWICLVQTAFVFFRL